MGNDKNFHGGQLIAYHNGDRYEIGKIKRITDDGAFVWYHSGETAAKTRFEDMHPIINEYCITRTIFGGEQAETAGAFVFEDTEESINAGYECEASRINEELGQEAETLFRHPSGKLTGRGVVVLPGGEEEKQAKKRPCIHGFLNQEDCPVCSAGL